MLNHILQFTVVLVVMTGLTVLMGKFLTKVFTGTRHTWAERATYRVLGVRPDDTMRWARYAMALLLSNAAMLLLGYALLRLQTAMPLNPLGLAAQSPDLAFNTAVTFMTNTNWQAYSGAGAARLPGSGLPRLGPCRRDDRRRDASAFAARDQHVARHDQPFAGTESRGANGRGFRGIVLAHP